MATEISPDTGAPINGATAKQWMENFKAAHPNPDEVIAHFFGNKIINEVLAQPDCIGIRCYYGLDDNGAKQIMLVGVKSDGANIWDLNATQPSEGGIIADFSQSCPPWCPPL